MTCSDGPYARLQVDKCRSDLQLGVCGTWSQLLMTILNTKDVSNQAIPSSHRSQVRKAIRMHPKSSVTAMDHGPSSILQRGRAHVQSCSLLHPAWVPTSVQDEAHFFGPADIYIYNMETMLRNPVCVVVWDFAHALCMLCLREGSTLPRHRRWKPCRVRKNKF